MEKQGAFCEWPKRETGGLVGFIFALVCLFVFWGIMILLLGAS